LNKETTDTILIGLEKTACLIDRCAVYEILYLNIETAASKNLEKTLLQLYTAILKYLAKGIKCSKGEYCCHHRLRSGQLISIDNVIKAAFTIEEVSKYLNDVEALEAAAAYNASAAESQCFFFYRTFPNTYTD
jgi:hypothetical protein